MERFAIKIDKKLKANLYKICRLCGIDNPDMVQIITETQAKNAFIDVEAELEMPQKIKLLLGLSITKDDKMPQTMCCLCVDKINDFYEFREMCYATDVQTRKLLGLKNVKKPALDIKPKVEIKEESIVPTPIPLPIPTPTPTPTPASNKNGNRKRKSEELSLKEENPSTHAVLPKKKLRFAEATIKEEIPPSKKKKLRFSATNEDSTPSVASTSKKSKTTVIEDSKLKKEPSPPVPVTPVSISNKKVRLANPAQKESATKKSKQKAGKNLDQKETEVKEEIKEEIKVELAPVALPEAPIAKVAPVPKLKFGCNICKERFAVKINLEAHTRTTHIPKVERYVCTACNEVLSKSFDIKNHQLWHKLSKTPYLCGCCGESILNTYAFSRHLRDHAFETPPALLVLDRECPKCHSSFATNFLYNIHICAVKARRCAGCNRLQRNDSEYLKHSAQCAKVYLNYSKHIMPSVEALEDAVRIKNENDVEAAAEEIARISGVTLDMAPVVQLTRLSSPIIMAASQCVSMAGIDDAASTSSKKSGKKGVSKKDLKRVDNLLKSTLDTLVSIKHEPEVHVDQEMPCVGERSDNDDHHQTVDQVGGLDGDFHHNDDSDNKIEEASTSASVAATAETVVTEETGLEPLKIKQEIDDTNEDNANKIGGGLKLKIKKEHGQLNSSIIEQQKSSEKRAEKRKKKKKHKDKEKDKQKLTKDMQDEQASQDSNGNNQNSEENICTTIRIKTEPQDESNAAEIAVTPTIQLRAHPEATIMTSIPMMQFQIACVSSGVEFNSGTNTILETPQTMSSANYDAEPSDVKPNRKELDRMLKISHVSSGIAMETDETEVADAQPMAHDGNDDEGNDEDDDHADSHDNHDDLESEHEEELAEDETENDVDKTSKDTEIDNEEITAKKIKKPLLKPKPKLSSKPKDKFLTTVTKSRNKACKSTAKPPNMPVLQISAVQSGITLEHLTPASDSEFTPIFIKPEPQNRGYSDEQPAITPPPLISEQEITENSEELSQTHSAEEQNYISTIDFNNITIKQEKDIEIDDVQITQKSYKSFAKVNGIKRKRSKSVRHSHNVNDKTLERSEHVRNNNEKMEEYDEQLGSDEEEEDDDEEDVEEEEEEDEEDDEEVEEEEEEEAVDEEEEREYRELEYPPELEEKKNEDQHLEAIEVNNKILNDDQESVEVNNKIFNDEQESKHIEECSKENTHDDQKDLDGNTDKPSFIIASVCSEASLHTLESSEDQIDDVKISKQNDTDVDTSNVLVNNVDVSTPVTASNVDDLNIEPNSDPNKLEALNSLSLDNFEHTASQGNHDTHLSSIEVSLNPNAVEAHTDVILITSNDTKVKNTHPLTPTLPTQTLQENIQPPEMALQLGQPFEVKSDDLTPQTINFSLESHVTDATLTSIQELQNSGQQLQGTRPQNELSTDQEGHATHCNVPVLQEYRADSNFPDGQENLSESATQDYPGTLQCLDQDERNHEEMGSESEIKPQYTLQNTTECGQIELQQISDAQEAQFTTHALLLNLPNTHNPEVQPQSSEHLHPVFKISSVTSTAINTLGNNEAQQIVKDNLEETTTIEVTVKQAEEVNLQAKPLTENFYNEADVNEGNEIDENEEDDNEEPDGVEDGDVSNDGTNLGNNLEKRQNDQNQEVLSQIRPTALSLHPYLEDISSSSNSLLSNSLSQTPPPPLQTAPSAQQEQQRLFNTEETENILNESNDALSRRSSEMASSTHQPHLAQQLPPNMPTFNFDNINEIAENNNNANIEREQLQDEQQQHQHTPNNP